jgi:predicted helicase
MSTAYHPQTDSQTECINQELEGYLRNFINQRQDDWDELLPLSEFNHNNHVHSSMQQTPFMVDTGRNTCMGFEPQQPRSTLETVNNFMDHMVQGLDEVKAALTKAKDKYMMYYNHRCEPALVFAPDDKVWLDRSNITTNWPSSKLSHR